MKNLKIHTENNLVEVTSKGYKCSFCKELQMVVHPVGSASYGICGSCAKQVADIVKKQGDIPDQV